MIERAGVDMHAPDSVAPGQAKRFAEQPTAVAPACQFRNQPEERELAFSLLAKVELHHADLGSNLIDDGEQLYGIVVDDRLEPLVAEYQPREPQPVLPDSAEQIAVMIAVGPQNRAQ